MLTRAGRNGIPFVSGGLLARHGVVRLQLLIIFIMARPTDLVQGTLDLLVLRTISLGPKHGWAIAKRIQQVSQEALQVQQGSLYPALHRLEQQGWIKAEWRAIEAGRMARFYSLTAAGRKQLAKELATWDRLSTAINLVIQEA
jgi:PadR family transcriptional regulator PadR